MTQTDMMLALGTALLTSVALVGFVVSRSRDIDEAADHLRSIADGMVMVAYTVLFCVVGAMLVAGYVTKNWNYWLYAFVVLAIGLAMLKDATGWRRGWFRSTHRRQGAPFQFRFGSPGSAGGADFAAGGPTGGGGDNGGSGGGSQTWATRDAIRGAQTWASHNDVRGAAASTDTASRDGVGGGRPTGGVIETPFGNIPFGVERTVHVLQPGEDPEQVMQELEARHAVPGVAGFNVRFNFRGSSGKRS